MPIHDRGYRRYTGGRHGRRAWWVIARAGLRERLAERRFLALLLFAWVPFLVRAVQLYIAANVPQTAPLLAPDPALFRDFLATQGLFAVFVTVYAGAGLIAGDRRTNALQIYLSKPLTRVDYVAGKFVILLVFLLAITWLPAVLLVVLQVLFAGSTEFVRAHPGLIASITAVAALQVLLSASAMLALSALSTSPRFAGVLFAGLFFFSGALYQTLRRVTGSRSWAWMSPGETLGILADAIFRMPATPAIPVPAAALVILVIAGASIWVLERRVRAVDVV